MKKILIILLAGLGIAACCNCDCPNETSKEAKRTKAPIVYIKQPVSFDGAEYTVNSVRIKSEEKIKPLTGEKKIKPENKFLVVNLTLKNNGTEAIERLPEMRLIDKEGRKFDQIDGVNSYWHPNYLKIDTLGKINPLSKKTGVIIFDVPENNEYKLLISPKVFSSTAYDQQIELKEQPQQ